MQYPNSNLNRMKRNQTLSKLFTLQNHKYKQFGRMQQLMNVGNRRSYVCSRGLNWMSFNIIERWFNVSLSVIFNVEINHLLLLQYPEYHRGVSSSTENVLNTKGEMRQIENYIYIFIYFHIKAALADSKS